MQVRHLLTLLTCFATAHFEAIVAECPDEFCLTVRVTPSPLPEAAAAGPVGSEPMKHSEVRLREHPLGSARANDCAHILAFGKYLGHESSPRLEGYCSNLPAAEGAISRP